MRLSLRIRRFFAAKVLKNSFILNTMYNGFYLLINKKRFLKEVAKRTSLTIFDYEELSKEMPFCPLEFVKDTNFYGYANEIKKYAHIRKLNYSMEHGLYYNDNYISKATYSRTIRQIITLSEHRCSILRAKTGKKCIAVGPYIHYAGNLLTDEDKKEIKKKYGKILLLMPTHSDVEDPCNYDEKKLIDSVKKVKEMYHLDTVFVNMFYHDILYTNYAKLYEEAGFVVTTAGHRYDLNFISRLRSIIEMADITVSNDIGTNLGYCIYLGKPHIMFPSFIPEANNNLMKEIYDAFSVVSDKILQDQYDIVSHHWGFNDIKTPEELHKLLS